MVTGPLPARGTPGFDVWVAALDVATSPPLGHGATTGSAQVPWREIEKLRGALEAAGLDWRAVKAARLGRAARGHAAGPGEAASGPSE